MKRTETEGDRSYRGSRTSTVSGVLSRCREIAVIHQTSRRWIVGYQVEREIDSQPGVAILTLTHIFCSKLRCTH